MHRLFTINYLLHEICSHLSDSCRELSVLARVSSTWFECAIPLLYRDVEIRNAFAPLGMVENVKGSGNWTFPSDKDFERFLKYAPYVQNLSVYSSVPLLRVTRMGTSKGVTYLFPNTRSIRLVELHHEGYPNHDHSLSEYEEILNRLLSPKIDQLTLSTRTSHIVQYVCQLAITRLSALRLLDIGGYHVIAEHHITLVKSLLTSFARTLTSVHIPLWLNTAPIIECLSKMPNLRNLTIGHFWSILNKEHIAEDREGFTSLISFSFDGSSRSLYDMFLNPYNFASLTEFYWNIDLTPADVDTIITTIVANYPSLKGLTLGPVNSREPWPVVPWALIQPISRCKELTNLSINGMHVSISLDELTEFLKSRTTWTRLVIFTSDPLRLQDLFLYAEHCPQLDHLGVFVDDRLESFVEELPHGFPSFRALYVIDLAHSHITKRSAGDVAEFLYHICKNPPLVGHLHEHKSVYIDRCLASLYVEEESRTKIPMSSKAKEFVDLCGTGEDPHSCLYWDENDDESENGNDDEDEDEDDVGNEDEDDDDDYDEDEDSLSLEYFYLYS